MLAAEMSTSGEASAQHDDRPLVPFRHSACSTRRIISAATRLVDRLSDEMLPPAPSPLFAASKKGTLQPPKLSHIDAARYSSDEKVVAEALLVLQAGTSPTQVKIKASVLQELVDTPLAESLITAKCAPSLCANDEIPGLSLDGTAVEAPSPKRSIRKIRKGAAPLQLSPGEATAFDSYGIDHAFSPEDAVPCDPHATCSYCAGDCADDEGHSSYQSTEPDPIQSADVASRVHPIATCTANVFSSISLANSLTLRASSYRHIHMEATTWFECVVCERLFESARECVSHTRQIHEGLIDGGFAEHFDSQSASTEVPDIERGLQSEIAVLCSIAPRETDPLRLLGHGWSTLSQLLYPTLPLCEHRARPRIEQDPSPDLGVVLAPQAVAREPTTRKLEESYLSTMYFNREISPAPSSPYISQVLARSASYESDRGRRRFLETARSWGLHYMADKADTRLRLRRVDSGDITPGLEAECESDDETAPLTPIAPPKNPMRKTLEMNERDRQQWEQYVRSLDVMSTESNQVVASSKGKGKRPEYLLRRTKSQTWKRSTSEPTPRKAASESTAAVQRRADGTISSFSTADSPPQVRQRPRSSSQTERDATYRQLQEVAAKYGMKDLNVAPAASDPQLIDRSMASSNGSDHISDKLPNYADLFVDTEDSGSVIVTEQDDVCEEEEDDLYNVTDDEDEATSDPSDETATRPPISNVDTLSQAHELERIEEDVTNEYGTDESSHEPAPDDDVDRSSLSSNETAFRVSPPNLGGRILSNSPPSDTASISSTSSQRARLLQLNTNLSGRSNG